MTLPQLSVRLGIIIYGELILFPILIQIFSNLFASLDMQKYLQQRHVYVVYFLLLLFGPFHYSICTTIKRRQRRLSHVV